MLQLNYKQDIALARKCSDCPHNKDILKVGRCIPGDICVRASSGLQIKHFFRVNPGTAGDYVYDEFDILSTIAIRCLSQQYFLELIKAPDKVVYKARKQFFYNKII